MLRSKRLVLRGFVEADIPKLASLLEDPALARPSLWIPYECDELKIAEWVTARQDAQEDGRESTFAVFKKQGSKLVGATGLKLEMTHKRAEIFIWIARPYRSQGYATEAARSLVRYGFEKLGLNRIYGVVASDDPGSGLVLKKLGMRKEGTLRKHVRLGDEWADASVYGILLKEFWVLKFTDPKVVPDEEKASPSEQEAAAESPSSTHSVGSDPSDASDPQKK
jgi:RimJ/RimL family protein N-acetyltransferase